MVECACISLRYLRYLYAYLLQYKEESQATLLTCLLYSRHGFPDETQGQIELDASIQHSSEQCN